jgi:hypothetical protein
MKHPDPVRYTLELIPKQRGKEQASCMQGCLRCPMADRRKGDRSGEVTQEQLDVLHRLSGLLGDGDFAQLTIPYPVLDEKTAPLHDSPIELQNAPWVVDIAAGAVDSSVEVEGRSVVERVQGRIPLSFPPIGDRPELILGSRFSDLDRGVFLRQAHLNATVRVMQSLREGLSEQAQFYPDVVWLRESWNYNNVGSVGQFASWSFQRELYQNRVDLCEALWVEMTGQKPEDVDYYIESSCRPRRRDGFALNQLIVNSHVKDDGKVLAWHSRLVDEKDQQGIETPGVLNVPIVCIAILPNGVWAFHQAAYVQDKSVRFTFDEFSELLDGCEPTLGGFRLWDLLRAGVLRKRQAQESPSNRR